jgi:hypothetical protein
MTTLYVTEAITTHGYEIAEEKNDIFYINIDYFGGIIVQVYNVFSYEVDFNNNYRVFLYHLTH